jgi:hypothetical protein
MSMLSRATLAGGLVLAALAPAAHAQRVAAAPKQPCPDTIVVTAAEPGATARFHVRGAVTGVVVIASQVRTVRTDRSGAELIASTPAQIVVPQRAVQLVLVPVDAANGIQVDRTGRDEAGRTVYLHAQGTEVALTRDGGTGLRVVADRVTLRDHP